MVLNTSSRSPNEYDALKAPDMLCRLLGVVLLCAVGCRAPSPANGGVTISRLGDTTSASSAGGSLGVEVSGKTSNEWDAAPSIDGAVVCPVDVELELFHRKAAPISAPRSACWAIAWLAGINRAALSGQLNLVRKLPVDTTTVLRGIASTGFDSFDVNAGPQELHCSDELILDQLNRHAGGCYIAMDRLGEQLTDGFLGTSLKAPSFEWLETPDGFVFTISPQIIVSFRGKGDQARVHRIEYRNELPSNPER